MFLILFGAPGVGKGTQAQRISKDYNIPQISTGEMLRAAVSAGTEMGKKAKTQMATGELVADDIILGIIEERIIGPDCINGFILDGFPRTIPQAEGLTHLLQKHNIPDFKCVEIRVPDEEIVKRLFLRRRADDNEETIRKRLEIYNRQTAPVKAYYEKRNQFASIDGNQPIDSVYESLKNVLLPLHTS